MANKSRSFWDNPFGGLADFNWDGHESFSEQLLAIKICEHFLKKDDSEVDYGLSTRRNYIFTASDSICDDPTEDEWRLFCEDGSDVGIYPEDYDSEEEYEKALLEARAKHPITITLHVEVPGMEALNAINPADHPNKRQYDAAYHLCDVQQGTAYIPEDTTSEAELEKCQFILNSDTLAAQYLTVYRGFLYAQAVKDHFSLPTSIPDEDEIPKTYFRDLMQEVAEEDPALAVEIWGWCIKQFGPYQKYMDTPETLYNFAMVSVDKYPDTFLDIAARAIGTDPEFCEGLLTRSNEFPHCCGPFIARALRNGLDKEAVRMFISALRHPACDCDALGELVTSILSYCKDYEDLTAMEAFKQHLYPLLKHISDTKFQPLLLEYEETIDSYIRYIESSSEKYQYSRRFAWRKNYKDSSAFGVDLLEYETEEAFVDALHEAKYGWRDWAIYDAKTYGLDVNAYETEDEFNVAYEEANNRAHQARRDAEARLLKKQAELAARKQAEARLAETDTKLYAFCCVEFQKGGKRYQYRTDDDTLSAGDLVVVPVGRDKKEVVATVVSIEKFLRKNAPFPVDSTKFVLRKHQ